NALPAPDPSDPLALVPEYRRVEVNDLYRRYLGRDADLMGLAYFGGLLRDGATVEQVTALLAASPEYFNTRGGGTAQGWLGAVYRDTFGRDVDQTGLDAFLGRLAVAPGVLAADLAAELARRAVAADLFTADGAEYRADLVAGYYRQFLDR